MFKKYKVVAEPHDHWGVSFFIARRFLLLFYCKVYYESRIRIDGHWHKAYKGREEAQKVCDKLNGVVE